MAKVRHDNGTDYRGWPRSVSKRGEKGFCPFPARGFLQINEQPLVRL